MMMSAQRGYETLTFSWIKALEAKAFCEKYARLKEGEWGWKGNWTRLLAHVLGVSIKTVETWGTAPEFTQCPERYKMELARINALKVAESILKEHELNQEFLDSLE